MKFNFLPAHALAHYDLRQLTGFEDLKIARTRRRHLSRLLRQGNSDQRALAKILKSCTPQARCKSAACPVCLRRFRIWWCSRLFRFIHSDDAEWTRLSIVPPILAYPVGELYRFDLFRFKDRLRKQISRCGLNGVVIVGGIDVALQTFVDRSPKWRVHVYLLVAAGQAGRVRNMLAGFYPADDDTRVPVRAKSVKKEWQDLAKVTTYTFKSTFDTHPPTGSDKLPVPDDHLAELAMALHQWGFGGRLIRHGRDRHFPQLQCR